MKFLAPVVMLVLPLSILSCGQRSDRFPESKIHEAPNALNAYQRIDLVTKRYDNIRLEAQVDESQKYWSGYYWATYQGGVGNRWQSSINSNSYSDFLYNIASFPEYTQLRPEQVSQLSPAEKYDLWTNDASMGLTRSEQQKVLVTAQNFGNTIPTWFGLCDGWALASSLEDEPVRMVRGRSVSGKLIDFYPEDIKALMAYYYTIAPKQYVSAGGRCNRPTVTKDADGRVIESECRDINPATFHLALDTYVGHPDQKLVLDISRDEMVWNYPIYSYRYQYNNRRTLSSEPGYKHAAMGTEFLVDVTADLVMVSGMNPTRQLAPQRSFIRKTWRYVLELDRNSNIIGGEWISDDHPDFAWIVRSVSNLYSRVDYRNLSTLAKASRGP